MKKVIPAAYKKIILFGDKQTGKSCFIKSLENNPFNEFYSQTKSTDYTRVEILGEKSLFLNVYEYNTYESLNTEDIETNDEDLFVDLLYQCQCAILFLDPASKDSFGYLKQIVKDIDKVDLPYITKIILYNKNDIKEKILSEDEVRQFANENKIQNVFAYSNITKENHNAILDALYTILYENKNDFGVNNVLDVTKYYKSIKSDEAMKKLLRIILLGDSAVGKTCIIKRFFHNEFDINSMTTIGITEESKIIKINDISCTLKIWDTAGQERFKSLPKNLYRNADGILLVYDVTSRKSFENISKWIKTITENINVDKTSKKYPIIYVLGNKIDLRGREVTREEGEKYVKEKEMKFMEVSAKMNVNINEVVMDMVWEIYTKKGIETSISIKKEKVEKKKCCN